MVNAVVVGGDGCGGVGNGDYVCVWLLRLSFEISHPIAFPFYIFIIVLTLLYVLENSSYFLGRWSVSREASRAYSGPHRATGIDLPSSYLCLFVEDILRFSLQLFRQYITNPPFLYLCL